MIFPSISLMSRLCFATTRGSNATSDRSSEFSRYSLLIFSITGTVFLVCCLPCTSIFSLTVLCRVCRRRLLLCELWLSLLRACTLRMRILTEISLYCTPYFYTCIFAVLFFQILVCLHLFYKIFRVQNINFMAHPQKAVDKGLQM
jgi:hypothetical protein